MSYFKSIRKGANLNYDKKILDIIKNEREEITSAIVDILKENI